MENIIDLTAPTVLGFEITPWFITFCVCILGAFVCLIAIIVSFARKGKRDRKILENAISNNTKSSRSTIDITGLSNDGGTESIAGGAAGATQSMTEGFYAQNSGTNQGMTEGFYSQNSGTNQGMTEGFYAPNRGTNQGMTEGFYAPNRGTNQGMTEGFYAPNNGTNQGMTEGFYAPNNGATQGLDNGNHTDFFNPGNNRR